MTKRSLPVITQNHKGRVDDGPLHLERARQRLGGEALSNLGAGRFVELRLEGKPPSLGVVLHQTDREVDVWLGATVVRRTRVEVVVAVDATTREISDEMLKASADARVFGAIERGRRVLYDAGGGAVAEGHVVERCRYGALVARPDGAMLAIGFRRLWPAEGRS
ncbi:MAG: hypothetical protein U0326_21100 [Polyangiales bacterium]